MRAKWLMNACAINADWTGNDGIFTCMCSCEYSKNGTNNRANT